MDKKSLGTFQATLPILSFSALRSHALAVMRQIAQDLSITFRDNPQQILSGSRVSETRIPNENDRYEKTEFSCGVYGYLIPNVGEWPVSVKSCYSLSG
jgi:hypothetical protein